MLVIPIAQITVLYPCCWCGAGGAVLTRHSMSRASREYSAACDMLLRVVDATGECAMRRVWRSLGFQDDPQMLQAAEMNGWVRDTLLLHMQRSIWLPRDQTVVVFFIGGINGGIMKSNFFVLLVSVRATYWLLLRFDDRVSGLDVDVREDRRAGPSKFLLTVSTACGFVVYHAAMWGARAALRRLVGGGSNGEL